MEEGRGGRRKNAANDETRKQSPDLIIFRSLIVRLPPTPSLKARGFCWLSLVPKKLAKSGGILLLIIFAVLFGLVQALRRAGLSAIRWNRPGCTWRVRAESKTASRAFTVIIKLIADPHTLREKCETRSAA